MACHLLPDFTACAQVPALAICCSDAGSILAVRWLCAGIVDMEGQGKGIYKDKGNASSEGTQVTRTSSRGGQVPAAHAAHACRWQLERASTDFFSFPGIPGLAGQSV